MQKKFKIEVDCANCAAKIETAVRNIPGVRNASVSFMAQKMLLDADDERFQDILQQAVRAAKRWSRISRSNCKCGRPRRTEVFPMTKKQKRRCGASCWPRR